MGEEEGEKGGGNESGKEVKTSRKSEGKGREMRRNGGEAKQEKIRERWQKDLQRKGERLKLLSGQGDSEGRGKEGK